MSGTPVELGRDEARELAQRELAHPRYDDEPGVLQRIVEWVFDRLNELLSRAADVLGAPLGLLVLVLVVALVATLVALRLGPLARQARTAGQPMFATAGRVDAAQHRAAADTAARAGQWAEAVVERFRAIVATLEERSIIDRKPGTTADEAARDAASTVPELAEQLLAAARTFDRVHYGAHPATPLDDERLRELDSAAQRARSRVPVDREVAQPVPR